MPTARALLEVTAGVIPGAPMPELTKQWAISSDEWSAANNATGIDYMVPHPASVLLAARQAEAQGYANLLMLQPDRYNWVRLDWIWL